jgi:hypothetical protein
MTAKPLTRIRITPTRDLLALPRDLRAAAAIVRALAPAGPARRWTIIRLAYAIADVGERAEAVLREAGL